VDLELERRDSNFEPRNPLTEVKLPASSEDPIHLQGGLGIALPASTDRLAQRLGDENLFYPETETATDTLVSPIGYGVEVFEQLRSPESPEQFRFSLDLPKGATLRTTEHGGGEVLSASGETIETTPPPYAIDAQGAEVPVKMGIERDSLVLEIQHQSRDIAYPVLLDPRFGDGKESPPFLSDWGESNPGGYALSRSGSSLVAISQGWHKYGANTYGQWTYTAPGSTAYIEELWSGPNYFYVNKCYTAEPHGYIGVFNVNNWSYNGHIGFYSGGDIVNSYYSTGNSGTGGNRYANVGVGVGSSSVELKCAHEFYVGGITVKENDPESPTINSVSGVPTGWFGPTSPSAKIIASDPGFGLATLSIYDGLVTNYDYVGNCTGLTGNRCPGWREWTITPPYVEGERTLKVTAEDATGKSTEWPPVTTKYDASTPHIELDGQLATVVEAAEAKEEKTEEEQLAELKLPVYNLRIEAIDGSSGESKTKQSGVKDIEVRVDGIKQEVPWSAQSCPASSCKMEETYQLKLVGLTAGVHELKVLATDQLGLTGERELEFEYFPATGMKDEYVMQHFPLPNGDGDESEEENPIRPELAVNVATGNLLYRQRDVEISGPSVDLEVERFYNSQLPGEEDTEWGKGWTLAQTPELEPEAVKEEVPSKASMVRTSGVLESAVGLPTKVGGTQFDKKLGALVTKEPDGGYEVADESGETDTALAFDESGKVTELRTSGYAKVDYSYAGGELSEIAVDDPASTGLAPEEGPEPEKTPVYAGSIGSSGSGNGQFGYPQGIATDTQGNIYVADTTNNRIEKFDAKGKYLGKFGSSGSGNGQFNSPRAVAAGPGGDVYVADWGNRRIEKFSPAGEYLGKFGSQGSGNGQFSSGIGGIAVDSAGNVWASDYAGHRLEKFSPSGEYLSQIADAHLSQPQGLAIDPSGNLWVVDLGYERLMKFNPAGEYVATIGEGQLYGPQGIATDAEGDIWVVDSEDNRVVEFDPSGNLIAEFGELGSGSGQFEEPTGLAIEPNGDFLVVDPNHHRVQKWITQAAPAISSEGASGVAETTATLNATVDPRGLDAHYSFEYGITTSYGASAPAVPKDIGSGAEGIEVSESLKGLKPWAIYHYRVLATNSEGTTYGEDREFTTLGSWTLESPPSPKAADISYLSDVSCPSTTACLAVGRSSANEGEGLGEAWNGEEWSLVSYSTKGRNPIDVSCPTTTVCWAVGTQGPANEVLVERYDYYEEEEEESYWSGYAYTKYKPVVPSGASNLHLNAISCTAASECTAVGYYEKEGKKRDLAERLTSSGWSVQSTPALSGAVLEDVSCTAANSCTAVGYESSSSWQRDFLAERWNGSEWSTLSTPAPPLTEGWEEYEEEEGWEYGELTSVSCASATSCLATGSYRNIEWEQSALALAYGGSEFTLTTLPKLSPGSTLESVSCATSTSCISTGHNATGGAALALAYDGAKWATQSSLTPKGKTAWLAGVSCSKASVCTAVGKSEGGGETATLAERVGGSWTLETPPSPKAADISYLSDVSCPSTTACLAVGRSSANEGEGLGEAWNGEEWSLVSYSTKGRNPIDVSCPTTTVCWAVGTQGPANEVLVERYDYYEEEEEESYWSGYAYTKYKPVVPSGASNLHLNAISCTAASECTAVGYYEKEGKKRDLAERLTSSGWSVQSTPALSGAVLEDVSCTAANSCTAVGYESSSSWQRDFLAERWNGSEWSTLSTPAPPLTEGWEEYEEEEGWEYGELTSVSCASATSCLATGSYRNIEWEQSALALAYGGSEFTLTTLPKLSPGSTLESVSCATSTSCISTGHNATGGAALALAYDGAKWATQSSLTPKGKTAWLAGVSCSKASVCTAVGKSEGGGETATLAERVEAHNQDASTGSASGVTREAATLNATVNPHSLDTHYSFQYGFTRAYGSSTASKDVGSGIQDVAVSASISGLESSRLYHYRVVATSEIGTTYGEDRTFTTPPPVFAFDIGGGEGEGQLSEPGGVATDVAANAYVADTGNHRVAKFSPTGKYLSQFGEAGSGNGQFGEGIGPIAIGPDGTIYVADPSNRRVQRFDATGAYLGQFGKEGAGNGQFGSTIGGIAVDQAGVVWVSDSANHRVERFNAKGEYLGKLGSEGAGNGQFASPRAIAIDPAGNAWVVDLGHERLEEFNSGGYYLRQAASAGKANGQLTNPAGVATDAAGNLWVVDAGNARLEEFNTKGQYLSQFKGAEEGESQLSEPGSLAIDPQGSLLIADSASGQVQKWFIQRSDASGEDESETEDDPKVEVETPEGLVESVEGDEAGQIGYEHEGQMLTAVSAPQGETEYDYDSKERLTTVTLPNGTWGKVTYDSFGRVKSVAVSVEGKEAETTYFEYQEEPSRRTTVTPEEEPAVTYEIGEDGSVVKWWTAKVPPEIKPPTGSLYNQRVEVHPEAINAGDQNLTVKAYDPEGIESIQIVANGNQLVTEKTCEQDWEKAGIECQEETKEMVTETENWPPGILQLEVIVTDRLNQASSVRFSDNIPYTPAPSPEEGGPPKFNETLKFREEFGLDLDLKGNELAVNERIFELIAAWNSPNTYLGEVARATDERWGSPLRVADAAEMEYREGYVATIGRMLEEWGPTERASTYAGYSVDNPSGGIIEIGFTSEPAANLAAFEEEMHPPAQDRLDSSLAPLGLSAVALVEKEEAISVAIEASEALQSMVTEFWVEYEGDVVKVGTTDPSQVSALLAGALGSLNGIDVIYQPARSEYSSGRNRTTGRMLAGDRILNKQGPIGCTAGFGAFEQRQKKSNGETIVAPFFLTSGHCYAVGIAVWRSPFVGTGGMEKWDRVGEVTRSAFEQGVGIIDAEAIRLESAGIAPRHIFGRNGNRPKFADPVVARRGQELCFSGAYTAGVRCGEVVGIRKQMYTEGSRPAGSVQIAAPNVAGDSGAPVWDPKTGAAVGILRGRQGKYTWVQPLLNTPNNHGDAYVGALQAAKMFDLHLMTGD